MSIFRKRNMAAAIVATAVLLPTGAALAIVGGFTDVADDHPHAAGIQWVADNHVTAGCTATTYCPTAGVTRGQMATFMQRLAGYAPGVAPSVNADRVDGLDSTVLGAGNPFGTATGGDSFTTSSTTFVSLPGASTNVTVPAGATMTLVANFTAESVCSGTGGYCNARILIDGVEAAPAVGNDFAFDSTDAGAETAASWESHAMQRIATGLGAGVHTVEVQVAVSGTPVFRVDDWALSAVGYLG